MRPQGSFIHAHHDVVEPSADDGGSGKADSALLTHLPRSSPEVMESIAVALLSLTAPGVCLRAGSGIQPEPSGTPYKFLQVGRDMTE